ncbi:MAG: hypothetical protein C0606_07355 [Hyphomicrobiales bacterium]|nr:MAG: hypothetical protein C0606_07355 [Hyphomicrobiales bacterium]
MTSFLLEAGRLAFVSVPLIAIFWLVRVLFRLCLRSLAMMDDAEHRRVMLDTYLFLTSEGKVTEEERPFVLQALFRPVPGTDGQDIAPPSITDVIQATKGKPS